MRKRVEYAIYKDIPSAPESWDGTYKTVKEAQRDFDLCYRNEGRKQDFVIVRVVEQPMPLHKRRGKQ